MPLVFHPPMIVDRFNLETLDPIRRQQFEMALRLAVGKGDLEAQLQRCEAMFYRWEYYRGTVNGIHIYDGWFLGGDCGSVFFSDRAEETGVVMTQSMIYAERRTASDEFVGWVRSAYEAARPKFDHAEHIRYWDAYQVKLGRKIESDDY